MLAVGPTTAGGCVQLLAPLTPESTIAKFLDRNGPGRAAGGVHASTTSTRPARALRARGVRLLYDTPRGAPPTRRINFVHPKDAGGVLVELVQPATDTGQSRPHSS